MHKIQISSFFFPFGFYYLKIAVSIFPNPQARDHGNMLKFALLFSPGQAAPHPGRTLSWWLRCGRGFMSLTVDTNAEPAKSDALQFNVQ